MNMETMTISQVSKTFDISTRMLRYYEKMGLISSGRREEYAYRVYDQTAISRLQQIIVLRKLRFSLKEIQVILEDKEQQQALAVFQESLSQLDKEIEALGTVRDILTVFVSQLEKSVGRRVRFEFLEDSQLLKVIGTLSPPKTNLKEEWSMEDLNKVSKVLESDMNIRVVYLPPTTVASSMYYGEQPEDTSGQRLFSFIKSVNLPAIKPDFRVYGFNNPNPQQGEAVYGYEFWVTIPEDIEVTEPLQKKEFAGGLYAALCIKMGDFQKWGEFFEQIKADEEYEIDWREPGGMGGCMEEELNAFTMAVEGTTEVKQLDLLIPIKKKE